MSQRFKSKPKVRIDFTAAEAEMVIRSVQEMQDHLSGTDLATAGRVLARVGAAMLGRGAKVGK